MELLKQDIGVWVKASEELPEPNISLNIKFEGREAYANYWVNNDDDDDCFIINYSVRHYEKDFEKIEWLKEIKQVYVLTEDQLNERDNKMYREGR